MLKEAFKQYHSEVLLNDVTFEFKSKQTYLLTGGSEIGKTTLLNILCGYDTLDKGKICIEPDKTVQYAYQDRLLLMNRTVLENMYIRYCFKSKSVENLTTYSELFKGILTRVGIIDVANQEVNTLSESEMQRLQLAQILLFKPDILLFNQPKITENIDHENTIFQLINTVFEDVLKIIVWDEGIYKTKNTNVLKLENGKLTLE
ncbi:MAG: ATP-binding cassette domain-containing protein [Cellulosilyticaceae bacterium]